MFRNYPKAIFVIFIFLLGNVLKGQDSLVGKLNPGKKLVFESAVKNQNVGKEKYQYLKIYKQNDNNDFLDSSILDASTFMVDERMKYNQKSLTEFSFKKVDKTNNGKVSFTKPVNELTVFFCAECKCFALDKCPSDSTGGNKPTLKSSGILNGFPFPPQFSPKADASHSLFPDNSLGYYHLVIDANADLSMKKNNTLYIKKLSGDTASYKIARLLKVSSSLSVFIKNYNFNNLEDINLSVNGNDYHYEQGLDGIYRETFDSTKKKAVEGGANIVSTGREDTMKVIERDLQWACKYLKSYTSLNIMDIVLLNQYKSNLSTFYLAHSSVFNDEAANLLNQILTWYPQLVSLTPIALTVPDNDEVEIELKIEDKNGSEKKYNVGNYRVKNGASVIAGAKGSLFFTNLRNRDAYIDSSDHKAKLDTKNCLSIGIGASGIVSFRTGSAYTPTINLGFFVPLDEDISPFGQIGPGINYSTKKVSLNLSAGLAFGKVSSIKSKYKDIDMRTISNLDVNGITEKVWRFGWAVSFGLMFNLPGN